MMIAGRIEKDGKWWTAEAPVVDVFTQGRTRADAALMLADAIESLINRRGLRVAVTGSGEDVWIEASDPAVLTAFVLRQRRQASGFSLAEVAAALGQRSRNAYARYERGDATPTLDQFEK